jgi:hypothetical protein
VLETSTTLAGIRGTCTWDPAVLQFPTTLGRRSTWSFGGSCTPTPGLQLVMSGAGRVAGFTDVTLGGRSMTAVVIERTENLEVRTEERSDQVQTRRTQVVLGSGVLVREDLEVTTNGSSSSASRTLSGATLR